jgi:hypothetical protein
MFVQVTFLAKVGGSLYPPTRRKVHDSAEQVKDLGNRIVQPTSSATEPLTIWRSLKYRVEASAYSGLDAALSGSIVGST